MKKVLIVSTVSRQFHLFEKSNIQLLQDLGYEVHGAADFEDADERLDAVKIIRHPIEIYRSPFTLKNIRAYKQLKKIMAKEHFDMVHCHSPMGGVLARLAAKRVKIPYVIYTAHGFHFYKGAPIRNWFIYYPIERLLGHLTDLLITINNEDYRIAQKFKAKKITHIPGIGINTSRQGLQIIDKQIKRVALGITEDHFVVLSVGELNTNKNHEVVIRAIALLKDPNIQYLICGCGALEEDLKALTHALKMTNQVHFLGHRTDVEAVCEASDLFVFPSYREGLSVSLMEAMNSGLPVVCSAIRGNKDLIHHEKGGYLVSPENAEAFAKAIDKIKRNESLQIKMGHYNIEAVKHFDLRRVKEKMKQLYQNASERQMK